MVPSVAQEYQQRLIVHVVWHPASKEGPRLAEGIYSHLTRDTQQPVARGLGIPVYFRTTPEPLSFGGRANQSGRLLPLGPAHHTAVVLLVDGQMIAGRDSGWGPFATQLAQETLAADPKARLFPVALTKYFRNLSPKLNQINFVRIQNSPKKVRLLHLLNSLTHQLCLLLWSKPRYQEDGGPSPEKVRIFLSHTKVDQEGLALGTALRAYVGAHTQLDTFFDVNDIPEGSDFAVVLSEEAGKNALLVLQTDGYSAREWCQREVLAAKANRRPVLVLHAVRKGEKRSFPYLGNVPTIRYDQGAKPDFAAVIGQMLVEVLRTEHFSQHFKDLIHLFQIPKKDEPQPLAQPPELLTLVDLRRQAKQRRRPAQVFVYPDPPLGDHELELIRELDPKLTLTTPLLLLATDARATNPASVEKPRHSAGARPRLEGAKVSLSLSESPDLDRLGVSHNHLEDAMVAFARYLLACGASLAFGGDLRPSGFTTTLFDMIRLHHEAGGNPEDRLANYLAWPIWSSLPEEEKQKWQAVASQVCVAAPADLGRNPVAALANEPAREGYVWARSLTAMRQRMAAETDARVLLGGRVGSWNGGQAGRYKGRYPGLVEEAYLTLQAGKPLYLIGAFGGAARAVIDALTSSANARAPEALRSEMQLQDPDYAVLVDLYDRQAPTAERIDYPGLVRFFRKQGVTGLHNGLSDKENQRLFETPHTIEMVYLVLKGFTNGKRKRRPDSSPSPGKRT